jgi:predicted amidophosphoribosyltransferase
LTKNPPPGGFFIYAGFSASRQRTRSSPSIAKVFVCDIIPAEDFTASSRSLRGGQVRCLKCRTDNPEANRFCRKCGTELAQSCSECGSEYLPEDEFCGKCGHNLKGAKTSAPVDYSQPQSYTPKHLADKILKDRASLEGEHKLITVLFADVANYTAMSGKLDSE